MAKLMFTFVTLVLLYFLKTATIDLITYAIFALPTGLHFFLKKAKKADTLHTVTLIITIAAMILPRLRGIQPIPTYFFYIALLLCVFYDVTYNSKLWYLVWTAFWSCTGLGLIEVAKPKLGDKAWLIFLAAILIGLRDLFERRKSCGRKICPLADERTVGPKNNT
ncbi:MAG: hypothetical protein WHT65_07645 [Pseudothermotoga sp.]